MMNEVELATNQQIQELFSAAKNHGATLNNVPIHCSSKKSTVPSNKRLAVPNFLTEVFKPIL